MDGSARVLATRYIKALEERLSKHFKSLTKHKDSQTVPLADRLGFQLLFSAPSGEGPVIRFISFFVFFWCLGIFYFFFVYFFA